MRRDARIKGSSISDLRGNTGSKGQRLQERTQPYSPWREAKTEGSMKLWSPSDTRLDPPAAALDTPYPPEALINPSYLELASIHY